MNIKTIDREGMISLLSDKGSIITFSDEAEEADYERLDSQLHQKIDGVITRVPGHEDCYFQSDDWWPNHLRGVELGRSIYSDELALELKGLLQGKFRPFRIILHVYMNISKGTTHEFSVLVTHSQIWMTQDNIGT